MHTIEIDFDVQKALWAKRTHAEEAFNDVLRGILGLPAAKPSMQTAPSYRSGGAWVVKGAVFPNGTEFRANHKGVMHFAKVEGGLLHVKGKQFSSPSAAAFSITGSSVNGWNFWQARKPGHAEWRVIAGFRP